MGSSLDWSREAYTLDDARTQAVRTVFKKMYDDGLIYRGYRVINWSVKGQSTCSDDELVYVERPAKLYTFKYSKDFPISIATTRPETKLGDTAVAVHPDGKWKQYIGQEFDVSDFGQEGHTLHIKVIGDEGIDDSFGTGALGVTTAHSSIDFEMYQKQKALGNDIGIIQVIGEDGCMTAKAGSEYAGLTVEEARAKVVSWLSESGLLEKEEDIMQNAGTSDRFKDVVEPLPKTQWFIDVNKKVETHDAKIPALNGNLSLKERMQIVLREGNIEIVPERFDKTYFHWIDNLRDWCISRQIWFGHQIPVWYRGEEMYVGVEAPAGEGWIQDPDTLDTWFSSGLWTFSTLGWPEKIKDLQTFHPTSVLETGYDILFFWVARMILMTTYTLGDVPFKTVYLHGLVRDEQGRKMSKSLGNIIDPLDMIEKYGTDATRLSLLLGSTPGNDMKLSEEKIAGFRNFTNKLWNMSRFMLLNISDPKKDSAVPVAKTLSDRWILSRLSQVIFDSINDLEKYNLSSAGERLRDFTWGDLADWYLEIAKIEGEKSDILNYLLNSILKLWHPFMPYVTETLWKEIYGEENILMVEKYPFIENNSINENNANTFVTLQHIITQIRALRTEYKIEAAKKIKANFVAENENLIIENKAIFLRLANLEDLSINAEKTEGAISFVESGIEVYLDFSSAVDTEKERARLEKEIALIAPYVKSLEAKLAGDFATSAPAPIVEKERAKLAEAMEKLEKLQAQISTLL
jgi:valyl-tRNA synthetase